MKIKGSPTGRILADPMLDRVYNLSHPRPPCSRAFNSSVFAQYIAVYKPTELQLRDYIKYLI